MTERVNVELVNESDRRLALLPVYAPADSRVERFMLVDLDNVLPINGLDSGARS